MTLLLTYHRIAHAADAENIHVLSQHGFLRQMELIVASGIRVAAPGEFGQVQHDGRHRIGLTFDDGYLSDLACADTLASHGLKGIFFVSSANIGAPGYLDAEDVRELDAMGMTVGSHSHQHARLTTFGFDEAVAQVRRSKALLEDVLGKPVLDFAYPGGACTRRLAEAVREAGFSRQFTLAWGINSGTDAATGVFRRSCVVQGMSDEYFLRLITGSNDLNRKLHYLLKGAASQLLGDAGYRRLRERYLGFAHPAVRTGAARMVR